MSVSARHLTPQEALGRLSTTESKRLPAKLSKTPRLVFSAQAESLDRVYVFGNASDDGYMILSADDSTPALLGYSDCGSFDASSMPDNLRWWLDEYARQIAYAAQSDDEAGDATIISRPDVAPKLTTLWDQIQPYNDQTPFCNGLPCPTGCVATAMAQIMNWHKWPEKPTGQKSFNSYYIGNLSIDFDQLTFDWDKMLDRYIQSSPQENIDAVATLMLACGYAAEMTYHNNSSGATGYNAVNGMMTHFGYSKAMSLECRQWYEIDEWDSLVYAELTENGPVYYEGNGDGGGHAFVCDGYDSATGLFHFNWGWSGSGNGYYRLSALNPTVQGTGGNSAGYNYTQDIIRGLKKAKEGEDEDYTLTVGPAMGVMTPYTSAELGGTLTLKGYDTTDGFKNYSCVTIKDFELGARLHHVATGKDIDILSNNGACDFPAYNKINIIRLTLPTELAEGEYIITPIWRSGENGPWQDMRMTVWTCNYVKMTVEGTTATFDYGEAEGRVEAKITEAPEYFTTHGEFTIKVTLTSTGSKDFSGLLCAAFMRYNSQGVLEAVDQGEAVRVGMRQGETLEWEYTSSPLVGYLYDSEDFGIAVGNANTGELLSPIYAIKVGNRYGKLQMSSYNFSITGSNFLDPSAVSAKTNIKVVSGEYEGPLAIGYSTVRDPFEAEILTIGEPVHLIAGEDKEITITGTMDNVEAGMLYYAHLMYQQPDGSWAQLSQYPVTVFTAQSYYSGVENVAADSEGEAVYYDTFGRRVENPERGAVYIRVTPSGKATKVIY